MNSQEDKIRGKKCHLNYSLPPEPVRTVTSTFSGCLRHHSAICVSQSHSKQAIRHWISLRQTGNLQPAAQRHCPLLLPRHLKAKHPSPEPWHHSPGFTQKSTVNSALLLQGLTILEVQPQSTRDNFPPKLYRRLITMFRRNRDGLQASP